MLERSDPIVTGLVRAALTGDQDAFAALYERYGALVFRTAYLLLGDAGRAEDVTQDVFVRSVAGWATTSPSGRPSPPGSTASPSMPASTRAVPRLLAWLSLDRRQESRRAHTAADRAGAA